MEGSRPPVPAFWLEVYMNRDHLILGALGSLCLGAGLVLVAPAAGLAVAVTGVALVAVLSM
jgi:hypothetical protein